MRLILLVAVVLFAVSACGKKAPLRPPPDSAAPVAVAQ